MKLKHFFLTNALNGAMLLALLCTAPGYAQVITRQLSAEENFEKYILWYSQEAPVAYELQPVDVAATLTIDMETGVQFYRFGIKQEMNLGKSAGTLYEYGNFKVWKIVIQAEGAKSLNFELTNLHLPDDCQMFIYSTLSKMIIGPVDSDDVYDRDFSSDIVKGEQAIIEVFLPDNAYEHFDINVKSTTFGFREQLLTDDRAFGDSEDCNVNIVCSEGDDWTFQAKAVCMIIVNNQGFCTGTVVNNECGDYKPYILTAGHCLTGSNNLNNCAFRFRYESSTCEELVEPNYYYTFNGADLRAKEDGFLDFALLELREPLVYSDVNFAGWNRNIIPIQKGTYIHHPKGDVKKITHDDGTSPNTGGSSYLFNLTPGTNGDFGSLEPGSSGAARFAESGLIVGSHRGGFGTSSVPCDATSSENLDCRFSSAWTGGGTNETRLSNWLSFSSSPPLTLQGAKSPVISGDFNTFCSGTRTFIMEYPPQGTTVSWSVTPSGIFGSATSGTGTEATLWPLANSPGGEATLTFYIQGLPCGDQSYSRKFTVGAPSTPVIQAPACFVSGSNVVLKTIASGATNYQWTFPTCPYGTPTGDPISGCWFNYSGNGPTSNNVLVHAGNQGGTISLFASNSCGTSSVNIPISFCEGGEPGGGVIIRNNDDEPVNEEMDYLVFPNPSNGRFKIKFDPDAIVGGEKTEICITDFTGKCIYRQTTQSSIADINLGLMPNGIYQITVINKHKTVSQKIIIR